MKSWSAYACCMNICCLCRNKNGGAEDERNKGTFRNRDERTKYVQAIEQTEQSRIEATKAVSAARTRRSAHVSAKLRAARKGAGTAVCQALTARHPFEGCERFEQAADFQSLQFISLTFDMLLPNEGGSNYGKSSSQTRQAG
ncbi:hypothetical protein PO124_29860 [Bacillus licheniformis]|nr:hypothetical protein [Bacillus licheniformis]